MTILLPTTKETPVDPKLLEALVCPETKATLSYDRKKNAILNKKAGCVYKIKAGIPVMTGGK